MGWLRGLMVAQKSDAGKLEEKFKNSLKHKRFEGTGDYALWVFEGRSLPEVSSSTQLVLATDGRNPRFFIEGNEELAKEFGLGITLSIGLSVMASKKNKLPTNIKNALENAELDESADRLAQRWDLDILLDAADAKETLDQLGEWAQSLDASGVSYRAAVFDGIDSGSSGVARGDLEDDGPYVGPSAYVEASWEAADGEFMELVCNESESLLNGMGIDEFSE